MSQHIKPHFAALLNYYYLLADGQYTYPQDNQNVPLHPEDQTNFTDS